VTVLLALTVGVLYGGGIYLVLQRSIIRLIFGLVLLGHAANVLIFASAGVRRVPPIVAEDQTALSQAAADPLPQALILTAIVIGFAVLSFTAVLIKRVYDAVGTDDTDEIRNADL
jgi:multicomponent Na+:H+ antiporter subunit C